MNLKNSNNMLYVCNIHKSKMYNKSITNSGMKDWEYIVVWLLYHMQSSIQLFKGRV